MGGNLESVCYLDCVSLAFLVSWSRILSSKVATAIVYGGNEVVKRKNM